MPITSVASDNDALSLTVIGDSSSAQASVTDQRQPR